MPVDYWKTPLDLLRRNDPVEQEAPPPEPEAAPVADLLPLPSPVEPEAKKPNHIRSIGTPEQQDRWRQLKAENQAKNESQRQQRLASRGQTPMDFIQPQQPQQQGQDFGPMQFMKNRNQAVQRMEQGLKGHMRPKVFEEEMEEKRFGEGVRQFDEGMGLKREALGAEQEYNQGRLGQAEAEAAQRAQLAREQAAQDAQRFEAGQRMKQQELASKPELLKQRGEQIMGVEKFKQEQIGQRQAAENQGDPIGDRMITLEETIEKMMEWKDAGRPINEAMLDRLQQEYERALEAYLGAQQ